MADREEKNRYGTGNGKGSGKREFKGNENRTRGGIKEYTPKKRYQSGAKKEKSGIESTNSGNRKKEFDKHTGQSGNPYAKRTDRQGAGSVGTGKRESGSDVRNNRDAASGSGIHQRSGSFGGSGARKPVPFRDTSRSGRPGGRNFGAVTRQQPVKKPEEMEGLASRRLALRILRDVTENGAFASLSLDKNLTASGLNPSDRRLVSRLVYDTLEHLLYLDHALEQVMAKPDTDLKLRNILRLGACQILLEDRIPESAATNTCVELCAELGMEPLKGVCNGILRNLVRKKEELSWPDEETEPDLAASIRCSVPLWLVRRLRAEWGDEAEQIMACREPETSVTVHPNLLNLDDDAFEKILNGKVWSYEKGLVPHAWRIRGMADIGQDSDFLAGNFSIQNESSMMACMAVAPRRGWQILDCCAAPGGKTCLLSEMMGGTGRVQAWELHEHRTALIAAQVKRLKLENVRPMTRDASVHREDLEMCMDAVLLDAPCSGLGALSSKPDIKYRVTEDSIEELTTIQRALLDAVCGYVKPGGVLVYSTCSVLKEENEDQISGFLERHSEFTPEKLPDTIPECFRQYEKTGLQLFEYRDHVEGFYLCRLRRKM